MVLYTTQVVSDPHLNAMTSTLNSLVSFNEVIFSLGKLPFRKQAINNRSQNPGLVLMHPINTRSKSRILSSRFFTNLPSFYGH